MGTLQIGSIQVSCPLCTGDQPGLCARCGNPLPARRRRWCSDFCAEAFAQNHHWDAARSVALDRAGWRCNRCTARLTLQVHHVDPVVGPDAYGPSCAHHQGNLEVLCEFHHADEHSFRRKVALYVVWADGQVSRQLELPLSA